MEIHNKLHEVASSLEDLKGMLSAYFKMISYEYDGIKTQRKIMWAYIHLQHIIHSIAILQLEAGDDASQKT